MSREFFSVGRSQKFHKVIGCIGLATVLVTGGPSACSENADVQKGEITETLSSWPVGWTPLLLGPDEQIIFADQKIIERFSELFWVDLFAPIEAQSQDTVFALANVMRSWPPSTPAAGKSGNASKSGNESDIAAWYTHFKEQQSLSEHSTHLVEVDLPPENYPETFELLYLASRITSGMAANWYFELDDKGQPDGIVVCQGAEAIAAKGGARCVNLFRNQGLTLVAIFGLEHLDLLRSYRKKIIEIVDGHFSITLIEADESENKLRYDLQLDAMALRPAFGSGLTLRQSEPLQDKQTFNNVGFKVLAIYQDQSYVVSEDLGLESPGGTVVLNLSLFRVLRMKNGDIYDDFYASKPTSCSSKDVLTREGEAVVTTTCQFRFHYGDSWVVRVFYGSPVPDGLPIEVKMITEYLDSIATRT